MTTRDRLRHSGRAETFRYRWRLLPAPRGVPACLSYIVEGNRIRLPGKPGGVRIAFPIGDVVEVGDVIVLCLLVPREGTFRDNVYAIDREGNLLWRIKPQAFPQRTGAYVGLSFDGADIRVQSQDGRAHDLDIKTGSLTAVDGE